MATNRQRHDGPALARSVVLLVVQSALWATLHSLLASRPVKQKVRERFGPQTDRWYRLAYVDITGLTLWPIVPLLLHLPNRLLYRVRGPWRWLMHAGQLLAVGWIAGSVHQVSFRRFVGLEQWRSKAPQADTLQTSRFYGCVRHPMFLGAMTFIWLTPTMTVNLLTAYTMATLYFLVATFLEENKLLAAFGDAYRQYRQRVPRLIPRPSRCERAWKGPILPRD